MTKTLTILSFIFFSFFLQAQIKVNGNISVTIANENPFLDISSFMEFPNSIAKGLLFPRTDLTTWQFKVTNTLDGITFPTAYDGMIVYNKTTGTTLAGQGIQTPVSPGFYYFYNPTGTTTITGGQWKPLGVNSVDGIIGNEILDATSLGGLVRTGAGTVASPYTLGISDNGVTTSKILDANVTAAKLTAGAGAAGRVATADAAGVVTYAAAALTDNIYTANGTLTGARTVTMGANNLSFMGTGSVGIGTTTPTTPLSVQNLYHLGGAVSEQGFHVQWNRSGGEGETWIINQPASGAASVNNGIRFATSTTTNVVTELMRIQGGNGFVGIGTTAPAGKFHVNNDKIGSDSSFVVMPSGNVGIGTAAPAAKLEVAGQVKITGGLPGAGKVLTSDATGLATWAAPGTGADNLGDHTATADLNLNGKNIFNGKYVVQNSVDGGNTRGIWMWTGADHNWGMYMGTSGAGKSLGGGIATAGAGFSSHAIRFRAHNGASYGFIFENGLEELNMSIRGSDGMTYIRGNVGIGTTAPNAPLQFLNIYGNRKILLWETGNNDHQYCGLGINTGILRYQVDTPLSNHVFYAGSSSATTSNELMRITGTGNVGIGITAPVTPLSVTGGIHLGGAVSEQGTYIQWNRTSGQGETWIINQPGGGVASVDNGIRFATSTSANVVTELMRIQGSNGNVGIGTTAPGSKLEVAGPIATTTINTDASLLALRRPSNTNVKYGNNATFKLGSYGTVVQSQSRLDLGMSNGNTDAVDATVMTWLGTGSVGIGTTAPFAKLEVIGSGNNINNGHAARFYTNGISNVNTYLSIDNGGNGNNVRLFSADTLEFQSGTNSMHLLPSGNLGIGTSTPGAKLEVGGQVKITGGAPGAGKVLTSDATGLATWAAPGTGADNLGNHTATADLNLNDKNIFNGKYVVQNSVDGGNTRGIWMWNGIDPAWGIYMGTPGAGKSFSGGIATAGAGFNAHMLRFRTGNSVQHGLVFENSAEELNMSIRGSDGMTYIRGNVGIGTTTPNAPLQFANTLVNRKIVLWENANNDNQYFGFGINGGTLRYQVDGVSSHVFYAGTSATTSNELMRIQGNGNVGIGTITPRHQFTFTGNLGMNNATAMHALNAAGVDEPFFWPRWNDNVMYMNYGSGGFNIRNNAGTTTMFMNNAGNVGIGTNNPTAKLHVSGGDALVTGGCFITASDRRIKRDITNYSLGLETLLKLNPVQYRFIKEIDPSEKAIQVGLIAQEVSEIVPSMVQTQNEGKENELLSLRYQDISIMTINAFKTVHSEIETLKKENQELKKMLTELLKGRQGKE